MRKLTPVPEKVLSKMNLQRTKAYRRKLLGVKTGLTMCDCGCGRSLDEIYGEDLKYHTDIEFLEIVQNEIQRINKHFEKLS